MKTQVQTQPARSNGKHPGGRPSIRTPANAEAICNGIADGKSLREVCATLGLSPTPVKAWIYEDKEFQTRYARAKSYMVEDFGDQLVAMADGAVGKPNEVVTAVKNAIDTRKWVMARLMPLKYGDRANETHITTTMNNFTVSTEQLKDWQARRKAAINGTVHEVTARLEG